MSLQGTLETIPLSDVLSLLAAAKKTGELRVNGGAGEGRVWLAGGEVVGSAVPRAHTPVDAVFELLRLATGTFVFDSDATAPEAAPPVPVAVLLADAQARLDVWRSIEAVVPSVRCLVGLAPALERDEVTVSRQQWKELVAVAAGPDVQGVMEKLALGEFEASRTVKELVDAGLAQVAPAPARPEPQASAAPVPAAAGKPALEPKPGAKAASPVPPAEESATRAPLRPVPPSPAPARAIADRRLPAGQASASATRRSPAGPPSRDEAEELVHQLAALSTRAAPTRTAPHMPAASGDVAPPQAAPTGGTAAPDSPAGADEVVDTETAPARPGRPSEEEPINRGMLLKFLSSVRP